jgi:hypothetical protein
VGIRETINKNPKVAGAVSAGAAVIAIGLVVWTILGGSESFGGNKAYFTIDDGKTWFADDADRITPFDYKGKEAVMCFVYTCDGGKTKFVSYMTRYTAESKKQREGQINEGKKKGLGIRDLALGPAAMEVKRPGGPQWLIMTDPRAQDMMELRCPDGTRNNLIAVDAND